jgi:DNA-binding HxlR family transcriptional regulator
MANRKMTSTNYLNQTLLEKKCPLNELLFLMSKRWMTDILFCIEEENNRFSGIREELENISDQILADRLRQLEAANLIRREVFHQVPLKVAYSLTGDGKELCLLLEHLCTFATSSWAKTLEN